MLINMILTKEVKIFKNNGEFVLMPLSKLSINSHKKVLVKCDLCGIEKELRYQDYNKITKNQSEMYHCVKCCKKKAVETKRKKYGNKMEILVDRHKSVIMEKYGVENVSQLESIKTKKRDTCMKNYGVEIPAKSEEVLERMKKTNLSRYGYEYTLQSPEIRNKGERTCIERYGCKNVFQSDEIKKRIKSRLMEKYGVEHPMHHEDIFMKQLKSGFKVMEIEGVYYQGSYELDFLMFTKSNNLVVERGPKIKYLDGKVYYPDFFIEKMNLIVEIKSTYTFQKEFEKNKFKKKACIDSGYNFMFVIDKDYTEFIEFILN